MYASRRILGTAIAVLLFSSIATAADEQATTFYQKADEARRKISKAGYELGHALGPLLNRGEAVSEETLLEKFYALQRAIDEGRTAIEKADVPASDEGKALAAAAEFLRTQRRMAALEIAAAVQIALDEGVPLKEKQAPMEKLMQKVAGREKMVSHALREALEAFRAKHEIEE